MGILDRFTRSSSTGENTKVLTSREGEIVLIPSFVLNSVKTVYNNTSTGYAFFPNIKLKTITDNIKWMSLKRANRGGDLYENIVTKRIGWDLVKRTKDAMSLKDALRTTVQKFEDGQSVEVVGVYTSQPISDFETGFMTLILRQTPEGSLPDDLRSNEKVVLAAREGIVFTLHSIRPGAAVIYGNPLPPASQWNGEYAIVIPDSGKKEYIKANSNGKKSGDEDKILERIGEKVSSNERDILKRIAKKIKA